MYQKTTFLCSQEKPDSTIRFFLMLGRISDHVKTDLTTPATPGGTLKKCIILTQRSDCECRREE